jgi:hypothetical protein
MPIPQPGARWRGAFTARLGQLSYGGVPPMTAQACGLWRCTWHIRE